MRADLRRVADLRIASLVPSQTELLVALGLREHLVARTGFCIHPAAALRGVAKVGGTKDLKLARLRQLAPTHVLVNVDENRLDAVRSLREFVPNVIVTHPCTPRDNLVLLDQLSAAFGDVPGVHRRAAALRARFERAFEALARVPQQPCEVLYLIWREPWMTVARDTYISAMLAQIGWRTLPATAGGVRGAARYPVLAGDEPWLAQVQRVLLSSEPYRFGALHFPLAQALCPAAQVQLVDGELLGWYGVRALRGLRYLGRLASDAAADRA